VVVDDGQIIVLGGLLKDEFTDGDDRVPGLGDIPVVGQLFRNENKRRVKSNLMVFLRPVVLRNQGAPIDVIVPTDGVGFDLEATAIVRGTANLEAARRLADFTVTRAAGDLYGRFYALLAHPAATSTVENYPADFAARLVSQDFPALAARREEILREWTRRYDGKSAPRN
jgi:Flp pilus assembly secretin CpaC